MITRRYGHGAAFTMLVGHNATPADAVGTYPPRLRTTITSGVVVTGNGRGVNGRIAGAAAFQTGTITVNNNTFGNGRVVLTLGNHQLISGLDYEIGAGVNATATNMAAAINRLPDYSAPAPGAAIVTVSYESGSTDLVDFRVIHYGTVVNLLLGPTTGFLGGGGPSITGPLIA